LAANPPPCFQMRDFPMYRLGEQSSVLRQRHLILYDGTCGLCSRLPAFVVPRDPGGAFDFAPLQNACGRSVLRKSGGDPDDLSTFCIVVAYRSDTPELLCRASAMLFLLTTIGGAWRAVALLRLLPRRLLDWGYDVIARNRYLLFGRAVSCPLPGDKCRNRYIGM
jgi:predicted DCC family thiol-disulfide oxidoreductase YuxK